MLARIRAFLAPPVFEDEEKTRAAALLSMIALLVGAAGLVGIIALLLAGDNDPIVLGIFGGVVLVFAGLFVALRFGYVRIVGILLPLVLWAGLTGQMFRSAGMRDMSIIGYPLVVLIAGLGSTTWGLMTFLALCVLSAIGAYAAEHAGWISTSFETPPPVSDLVIVIVVLLASGALLRNVIGAIAAGYERTRQSARNLAENNRELEASRTTLESQTHELARRARYLQATSVVARAAAAEVSDLERLLSDTVMVISQQFGFYHVGLFLLGEDSDAVRLRAASSDGGQRMLSRSHQMAVGEGLVGYVAQAGTSRVAFDVGADVVWVANPDLPGTRSEAALPLRARGQVIGVLDVQSTEAEAFSDEDVTVLQSLADQVAVAIDNARLLQQAQESIAAERRALGELDRERWGTLAREVQVAGYRSDAQGTVAAGETWHPESVEAIRRGEVVLNEGEQPTAAIPIQVRGQVIGVIDGGKPGGEAWTAQEIELLQTLTEQLGVALEGSRLYRETQRRAAREQVIAETTSRMREPLDLENVLQTAVGEMRRVLDLESLAVRLTIPETQGDGAAGGEQ